MLMQMYGNEGRREGGEGGEERESERGRDREKGEAM